MTIQTRPVFYYINGVTKDNNLLNFSEPNATVTTEKTAQLNVGSRSMTNLMTEVERALNDAGENEYTVSFDRDTRLVTIEADDEFELLVSSGSNIGLGVFSLIGFTGADRTGTDNYVGDTAIGTAYLPQIKPQRFKSFDNNLAGIETTIRESASGKVEVITFGELRLMEMELTFITNRTQGKGSFIENNQSAVSQANSFMSFCISKSDLEYMADRSNRATFDTVILERTPQDRNGTSYELNELIDRNLDGYYTTGTIVFRKVD